MTTTHRTAADCDLLLNADRISIGAIVERILDDLSSDADERPARGCRVKPGLGSRLATRFVNACGLVVESTSGSAGWPAHSAVVVHDGRVLTDDNGKLYEVTFGGLVGDRGATHAGEKLNKLLRDVLFDVDQALDVALHPDTDERLRRDHPREL